MSQQRYLLPSDCFTNFPACNYLGWVGGGKNKSQRHIWLGETIKQIQNPDLLAGHIRVCTSFSPTRGVPFRVLCQWHSDGTCGGAERSGSRWTWPAVRTVDDGHGAHGAVEPLQHSWYIEALQSATKWGLSATNNLLWHFGEVPPLLVPLKVFVALLQSAPVGHYILRHFVKMPPKPISGTLSKCPNRSLVALCQSAPIDH